MSDNYKFCTHIRSHIMDSILANILLDENVEVKAVCRCFAAMQVCWVLSGALDGGLQRMTPRLCILALMLTSAST